MPAEAGQRKVIFFAGAPPASVLTWDESALTSEVLPAFLTSPSTSQSRRLEAPHATDATQLPAWRSISLHRERLHTGLTPPTPQPILIPWDPEAILDASFHSDNSIIKSSILSTGSTTNSDNGSPRDGPALYEEHKPGKQATSPTKHADDTNFDDLVSHSFALHSHLSSSQLSLPTSLPSSPVERQDVDRSRHQHSFASTISATTTDTSNQPQPANQKVHSTPSDASTVAFTPSPAQAPTPSNPAPLPFPPNLPITTLSALPSASIVSALHPQTLTVNLVVVLLRISPLRSIPSKRFPGTALSLVELTVADDTRSGTGVNLWLPTGVKDSATTGQGGYGVHEAGDRNGRGRQIMTGTSMTPAEIRFESSAQRLRLRDVVLLRNVVLGAWKGQVYAQSLRRGLTKLEVLWRGPDMMLGTGDSDGDAGGIWNVRELESCLATEGEATARAENDRDDRAGTVHGGTTRRPGTVIKRAAHVRRWTSDFVGVAANAGAEPKAGQQRERKDGHRHVSKKRADTGDSAAVSASEQRRSKRTRILPPDTQ